MELDSLAVAPTDQEDRLAPQRRETDPKSQASFTACIFDLDGVVLDSEPTHDRLVAQVLAEGGFEPPPQLLADFRGHGHREFFDAIRAAYGLSGTTGCDLERFRALLLEAAPEIPVTPGVHDVLARLRTSGVPTGLATSTPTGWALDLLSAADLKGVFSVVVGRDEYLRAKPAPDVYLRAIELLGVPARSCLAIEDSLSGARAAHAAGATLLQFAAQGEERFDVPPVLVRITCMRDFPFHLFSARHPVL
jgi:HAD superfamily hydrolase (TIGR01509 family)